MTRWSLARATSSPLTFLPPRQGASRKRRWVWWTNCKKHPHNNEMHIQKVPSRNDPNSKHPLKKPLQNVTSHWTYNVLKLPNLSIKLVSIQFSYNFCRGTFHDRTVWRRKRRGYHVEFMIFLPISQSTALRVQRFHDQFPP